MTGFERLEKQAQNEKDIGTTQVVEYLLSRKDLEQHYLNKEKSLKEMRNFIKDKSSKHKQGSWTYVSDSVVLSWAVMYFSLPNSFLKIQTKQNSNTKTKTSSEQTETKDNVVSLEDAKKNIEKKKEASQLSLFGGEDDDKG